MPVDAVLLDLYGTLVDIHTDEHKPELWERMAAMFTRHRASYTPQELEEAFFATIARLEEKALKSCRPPEEVYPEVQLQKVFRILQEERRQYAPWLRESHQGLSSLDIWHIGHIFRKISTEYIRLYDGADTFLKNLRDVAKHVILLTNAQSLFTSEELHRLGIYDLFDAHYISSDWCFKKPAPYFFSVPVKIHHLDPARTVMIGNDAFCDIQGAQAAGMHTIYLRTNLSPDEPLPQADLCVEGPDYDAILAYLRESSI